MVIQQNNQKSNNIGLHDIVKTLAERIARVTKTTPRIVNVIPGLVLSRWEKPSDPVNYIKEPSICLVAQGSKEVTLGDEVYTYDPQRYLISSVNLPVSAQVTEASKEKPFYGLMLDLDQKVISQLMVDSNLPAPQSKKSSRGMAVGVASVEMIDAFIRLIDLLDTPSDIPIMAPHIKREIFYRLLTGDQGDRIRQISIAGTHGDQIAKTIKWLETNYDKKLRVEDLASNAGMSASGFHTHFRAITAMSPLQFQKKLRLNEARRIMLTESLDAATAAFQVGYESPSQFSREYSRLFGAPPTKDIKTLSGGSLAMVE